MTSISIFLASLPAQCVIPTSGWTWTTWRWPNLLSHALRTSLLCSTPRYMWIRLNRIWRTVAGMYIHCNDVVRLTLWKLWVNPFHSNHYSERVAALQIDNFFGHVCASLLNEQNKRQSNSQDQLWRKQPKSHYLLPDWEKYGGLQYQFAGQPCVRYDTFQATLFRFSLSHMSFAYQIIHHITKD